MPTITRATTATRIACLFALAAPAIWAQTDTATITGLVTDVSGAAVAGAQVQAIHQDNGLEYTTQSNETGNYVLAALPIGNYDLSATSEGFQTLLRPNIALSASSRARVDVQLQVGAVTETVEVTAELPLLESETSSLGQAIENKTITQMPLNGRNYQELAVLTAGVLPSRRQNFVEDAFSVNGAGFDQNVFTLDGADNNNYFSGVVVASNQAVKPSIDAIQEFKIETHNYGAEFGRGGGAIVQATTALSSSSCATRNWTRTTSSTAGGSSRPIGRTSSARLSAARWSRIGCSTSAVTKEPGSARS